jgi:hypothetical protein
VSRVVAVSNRVADPRQSGDTGGLAVGVLAALERGGGVWLVNPHDILDVLRRNDIGAWRARFIATLEATRRTARH